MSSLSQAWAGAPANLRGMALMLLSTFGFALMHALIRDISQDLHPFQIAFFRNAFGLVVFLPWFLRYGFEPLRTNRFGMHGLRAVLNVCAMLCFFTALSLRPLAEVTALGFTAPIFAAVLAVFVLGEVVRLRRWTAILLGFVGALIILRPGFQDLAFGSWLVIMAALLWGCTLIVIKLLGRTESAITITSYMNILLALLSLGPALVVWRWPQGEMWLILIVIGISGTLSQVLVAQSLKLGETAVVMPLDFFKLIWASLLGWWMFQESPEIFVWIGGAVIIASSSYIAYRESRSGKKGGSPPGPS